ncbi:MAG TPA: DUF4252 domain-containing protein [Blastocatellia bacterium]|nr:DUF4252 domain-containing protein [Blastocatellia bacterium]
MKAAKLGLALAVFAVIPAYGQDAKIDISQLERFNDKADKVISVDVNESLIRLAMSALNDKRSVNEAKIKDILSGLKGVYVRRYEFEKENEFTAADVEAIRAQLSAPGWERIANVRSKREGSYDVVMMYEGSIVKGIGVIAAEPRALTVVNVVGTIDLAKFRDLEGKFGIPNFGLEQMPGVTIKDNRKDKTPEDDMQQGKQSDDKIVITEKRAEKKPPQLIRPEKPPQE